MIATLFAIAFAILGRQAYDCQQGAMYIYEDATYRLETDGSDTLTCAIDSDPEMSLSFVTVSYDDYHGEIITTRTTMRVGDEFPESVTTTTIYTESR